MMLVNTHIDSLHEQSFDDAEEHLNAALGCMHRLLTWQIALTRHTYRALADDEYRGLYIPDVEVDVLGTVQPPIPEDLATRRRALARERDSIEVRACAAALAGVD